MKTRWAKYSLAAGLALLLALPAVAYSQGGPRGPRFSGGEQAGRGRATGAAFSGRGRLRAAVGRGGGRLALAGRALAHADEIALTDAQREQISVAQRGNRETSINRRAEIQIAELDLRDLMRAEAPDIGAVEAKMRELSEFRIAEQTGALRLDAAVGEILTAEQIDQLGELREDRAERRGDGNRARRVGRDPRQRRGESGGGNGGGNPVRRGAPPEERDTINAR